MFGWQALYYAASLSIVLVMVCHGALPESLQYSAMRGNWRGIAQVLCRLNPSQAARYTASDRQFMFPEPSDRPASMSLATVGSLPQDNLSVWAGRFFILFGIWGLSGWVPTAMMQRGEGFATSFSFGALIQAMAFIGSLLCGYIADRGGEDRQAMAAWWLGGAISVGILVLFNIHALNMICVGAAGFCILGGQNVLIISRQLPMIRRFAGLRSA